MYTSKKHAKIRRKNEDFLCRRQIAVDVVKIKRRVPVILALWFRICNANNSENLRIKRNIRILKSLLVDCIMLSTLI